MALYGDYANLGRGRQSINSRDAQRSRSESMTRNMAYTDQYQHNRYSISPGLQHSASFERPYLPSRASFSTPRRSSAAVSHSATPSTESSTSSTSLSPSNSASQLGLPSNPRKQEKNSTNASGHGPRLTATSLARLKDLESNVDVRRVKRAGLIDVPLPWRPYYLQRKVLAAFFAIFAACIIVSEALLDYSGRNAGLLGETNIKLRYLLCLLPPAVLTLVAALWSRVEYQAKMSAPWLRLVKGPESADKSLLLDYFSMMPPRDAIRAIKNGDTAVACASIVAMLLKIVIVVSTGMISLKVLANMEETAAITLTTQLVNDGSRLATIGTTPLLTMLGLQRDNLTFPDGTSSQFAFQEFTSDLSSATQLRATVDGFAGLLNCVPGQLTLNGIQTTELSGVRFNTTIVADSCTVRVPLASQSFGGSSAANRTHFITRMAHASCDDSEDASAQRLVVVYGTGSIDSTASLATAGQAINGSIPESQQILCTPSYAITQVDIVKNGSYVDSVAVNASPQSRSLSNVQPWDIAQAHFDSLMGSVAASITDVSTPYFTSGSATVNVDAAMYLAFGLQAQDDAFAGNLATSPTSYFDADTLQNLVIQYYQQYSALIAHQALMQKTSIAASCIAYIGGDRLVVGTIAVQIAVVLLAIILLVNIVAICTVPTKGFLPRDPQSILDMASLLVHSKSLRQVLKGAGGADKTTLRSRVKMASYYTGVEPYERGSAETKQGYFRIFSTDDTPGPESKSEFVEPSSGWHYPFGLHPIQRILMYVFLVGLATGLEITLRLSMTRGGFSTVDVGGQEHFIWTMVPALVVTCIALFFSATDFRVRAIVPFAELARPKGGSVASMTSRLLDSTALMAFYKAIRTRNYTVAGTAAAVSAATLLPIFAANLFSAMTVPVSSQVQLITQDFFSNSINPPRNSSSCSACMDGMALASLILNGNLSYPAFTYEDLALSSLLIIPLIGVNETDDLETTATVPAVRSVMSCNYYSQHDITVNLTTNYRIGDIVNPLRIDLPGEPSLGNTELLPSSLVIGTATSSMPSSNASTPPVSTPISADALFGAAVYRPFLAADGTLVTHWIYAWGQLNNANTNQTTVQSISALACNETMQQLDVKVTFDGATLDINPDLPLERIEDTARPSDAALSTNLDYAGLNNLTTAPNLLDSFFASLVSSRYAIPASDLGATTSNTDTNSGPGTQNNTVADAIVRQHGIIRAQVVSAASRRPSTASSRAADVFPVDSNGTAMGDATQLSFTGHLSSVTSGRRRLLQDLPTTRILQSLLGLVILASIVSWATFPGPSNVLPRPPTSIASVAALLVDGNVFAFFGQAPEWQPVEALRAAFRDGLSVTAGFTLGWARVPRRRRWWTRAEEVYSGLWGLYSGANYDSDSENQKVFGVCASRTGGWSGGEAEGLGLQARVGYAQRELARNWGQQPRR